MKPDNMNNQEERLDAQGDPLDLGDDEVRTLIAKLQQCLADSEAAAGKD
ncbi:hypothetical protein VM94_02911 [Janthinobacterium sp. KBS0711]|nr:hypothetical protein VM94_02911 [Janthinobacterium sp. KBS0711]